MPSSDGVGWFAYAPQTSVDGGADGRFEIADVGRYGRSLVRRFVTQARAGEQPTLRSIIGDHLGVPAHDLPVVEGSWPAYEHVDVQGALDRASRLRPVDLYRERLDIGLARLEDILDRTDGVTASFLKELLRRAADRTDDSLSVTADDLDAATDDLLDTRNRMTRAVPGFRED